MTSRFACSLRRTILVQNGQFMFRLVTMLAAAFACLGWTPTTAQPTPAVLVDECENYCFPQIFNPGSIGSSCATVTITLLNDKLGTALPDCQTCTTCDATLQMVWDCTNCSSPCTFVAEGQSYDKYDQPILPPTGSTGTTNGIGRQNLTIGGACNGVAAEAGVSISGLLVWRQLFCTCHGQ
jgi:hypothetical protein